MNLKKIFLLNVLAKFESTEVKICEESEVATILFSSSLPTGAGKLHISYTGIINDRLKGFYRSKYTDSTGATKYTGVTQFEVLYYYNHFYF